MTPDQYAGIIEALGHIADCIIACAFNLAFLTSMVGLLTIMVYLVSRSKRDIG